MARSRKRQKGGQKNTRKNNMNRGETPFYKSVCYNDERELRALQTIRCFGKGDEH